MKNNWDLIENNNESQNSFGGTEIMMRRIYDGKIPRDLLQQFQIIPSRVREVDGSKYRIFYCHNNPEDPETKEALSGSGWQRFHIIVCVSNWQAQELIRAFDIPWSKIVVMLNAIEPIERLTSKDNSKIRLIYTSTPQRGLAILVLAFKRLCETYKNLHLDVFSSFEIYGWKKSDEQYKKMFEDMTNDPNITNHGFKPREEVLKTLQQSHIFAYPCVWRETSCLGLMEAMAAGLICVHPNYGALYETAACWTHTYNFHEYAPAHAQLFYQILNDAIVNIDHEAIKQRAMSQSVYANAFYNWNSRSKQWEALLRNIAGSGIPKEVPPAQYTYKF